MLIQGEHLIEARGLLNFLHFQQVYYVYFATKPLLEANIELVRHVPMELSYLIHAFWRAYDGNEVSVKVRGSRRLENGLVVSEAFKARTASRATAMRFELEILQLKELCANVDIGVETIRKLPVFS